MPLSYTILTKKKRKTNMANISKFINIFLILYIFTFNISYAQDDKEFDGNQIKITADKLLSKSNSQYVEFQGNVKVIKGNTSISSENLKIFYKADSGRKNNSLTQEAIEKIVASGNVEIVLNEKKAITKKAVYVIKDQVLILTGNNTRVVSGKNIVAGNKITIYLADEKIEVESGKKKQVEAVFYSNEKD
ncbi:lipopolysaccharide export system protein LptA [Candidatus Magnetomoraceae bacterium gMMP-15]